MESTQRAERENARLTFAVHLEDGVGRQRITATMIVNKDLDLARYQNLHHVMGPPPQQERLDIIFHSESTTPEC